MVRSGGLKVSHELRNGRHRLYRLDMSVGVLLTMEFCVAFSKKNCMG
jgi:hypothetical protein